MPYYDYRCPNCNNKKVDIMVKLEDKETTKVYCDCRNLMTQEVAKLRFKLEGGGWANQEYGITQQEMNSNLDLEKKIENEAYLMQGKDKNIKEL